MIENADENVYNLDEKHNVSHEKNKNIGRRDVGIPKLVINFSFLFFFFFLFSLFLPFFFSPSATATLKSPYLGL